jgi:hypothetical protein
MKELGAGGGGGGGGGGSSSSSGGGGGSGANTVLLYASWQTAPLVLAPVLPTQPLPAPTAFGNFEVFHPAQVPPGLRHVAAAHARAAAAALGVPFLPALVGFEVGGGGRALPVVKGVVVHAHRAEEVERGAAAAAAARGEKGRERREAAAAEAWARLARGVTILRALEVKDAAAAAAEKGGEGREG